MVRTCTLFPIHRQRRAFTLMELCLIIATTSVMAVLVTTLLHGMLRHQSAVTRQFQTAHSLFRLANQFRDDVHGATDMKQISSDEIVLTRDNTTIRYWQPEIGRLRRTIESNSRRHQDDYDLIPDQETQFHVVDMEETRFVHLRNQHVTESQADELGHDRRHLSASRSSDVVAEFGRDWRRSDQTRTRIFDAKEAKHD